MGHNNHLEIWALKSCANFYARLRTCVRSTADVRVRIMYVCSCLSWTQQLCEQFERATAEYRYDNDVQWNRAGGDCGSFRL